MSEHTTSPPGDHDLYGHLRARGEIGWRRVMQSEPEASAAVPGSYPDLSHNLLFGDIWQRPHLSLRERRLVVLTLLAAYGRDEPMVYHLRRRTAIGRSRRSRVGRIDRVDRVLRRLADVVHALGCPAARRGRRVAGRGHSDVSEWREREA